MRRAALAVLLLAAACGPRAASPREERRQVIEGLTLSQSYRGTPAWTLRSRLARLREDEKTASLESPTMEFYRDGRAVSRVTALAGEIATDTHDVRLSSSVVLDSFEDHAKLETDRMDYSSKRARFHTESAVVVRRPEAVVRGEGMEATPDLSEIRIFRQRSTITGAPPR